MIDNQFKQNLSFRFAEREKVSYKLNRLKKYLLIFILTTTTIFSSLLIAGGEISNIKKVKNDDNAKMNISTAIKVKNKVEVITDSEGTTWKYSWNSIKGPDGNIWMDRNVGAQRVATSPQDGPSSYSSTTNGGYGGKFNWDDALKACPSEYRLPVQNELIFLNSFFSNIQDAFNSTLKLSMGGEDVDTSYHYGKYGIYWSSDNTPVSKWYAYALKLTAKEAVILDDYYTERRISVRCIFDAPWNNTPKN